jgi:hypothetical protein
MQPKTKTSPIKILNLDFSVVTVLLIKTLNMLNCILSYLFFKVVLFIKWFTKYHYWHNMLPSKNKTNNYCYFDNFFVCLNRVFVAFIINLENTTIWNHWVFFTYCRFCRTKPLIWKTNFYFL